MLLCFVCVCCVLCVENHAPIQASMSVPIQHNRIIYKFALHSPVKRSLSEPIHAASNSSDSPPSPSRPSTPVLVSPPRQSAKSHYSGGSRRACITLLQAGIQPSEVLVQAPSDRTLRQWKRKWDATGSLNDSPRPGRPTKLEPEIVDKIVNEAKETKFTTPKGIKRKLNLKHVHPRTIRRKLNKAGIFGRIARVTPPLFPVHIQKRLSFVNGYGNWTNDQWGTVLWSDEMSIHIGKWGQEWVQRMVGTAWDPENCVTRAKHPPKLHVWGCFCARGVGHIHIFEENLDKELMKKILSQHLLQSAKKFWPKTGTQWWFQQDNDPKHSSRLVQDWIQQKGIDVLDWPPYSPDLNPIENLWADLKRRVEKRNAKNLKELKEHVENEWKKTSKTLLKKLVNSMQTRLQQVREREGCMSDY